MTEQFNLSDLPTFNMSEELRNESDIAEYLTMVLAEKDAAELAHALKVIDKAKTDN